MPAVGPLAVAFVVFQLLVARFVALEARPAGRAATLLAGAAAFVLGVLALLVTNSLLVVALGELLFVGLYYLLQVGVERGASPN